MKWSWKIGELSGIGIYVHGTFLMLLAWVALSHLMSGHSVAAAMSGLLFVVTLFAIVVLHELGHALMAKRFGIATRDITLLPIGGMARLERMPEDPKQELLVSLAGPAVNVVLGAGLFVILTLMKGATAFTGLTLVGGALLTKLLWVNVALAGFNLLPAFPMDGGRVLRAALATRMDYVHATQIAASVGQAMALLFGFVGLFANPFLLFIAFFVWTGAQQEAAMVQMKAALGGIPISRAMTTDLRTLAPGDTLERAIQHVLGGAQQDFPVADGDRLVGVLTRSELMRALAERGQQALVTDAMYRTFETADPAEMMETVFGRLQTCECHALPVVRDGHLLGMVSLDNVGRFLMVQAALRKARA